MTVRRLAPVVVVIMMFAIVEPAWAQTASRPTSIRAAGVAALARLVRHPVRTVPAARRPAIHNPIARPKMIQNAGIPSAGSGRPGWKNHSIAIFGGIGAGVGLAVGIHDAGDRSDCPAGRSCSTAGLAVPGDALLGWGIGALVGAIVGATW